jgi:Protein of unknown function (DUF3168)
MFEAGLYRLMKNDAGISALVGGRIWGGRAPKTVTDSSYPLIVWTIVSTVDLYSIQGASGYRTKRVQIDSYARTYIDSVKVSDAVRALLQNFRGTLPDGTFVESSVLITDQDFTFEPGISGQLFRHLIEVEISYLSAVAPLIGPTVPPTATLPYDIAVYVPGAFTGGMVCSEINSVRSFTLPASLTGSIATLDTAATADTVFSITKNGAEIGTVAFAASSATGVFAMAAAAPFNRGDIFKVIAPLSPDATAAGLSLSLLGSRP